MSRNSEAPRVAQFGFFRPSLVYYTAGRLEACASPDEVAEFLAGDDEAFVVMPQEEFAAMQGQLPPGVRVISREPRFPKQGKIVNRDEANRWLGWPRREGWEL